MRVPVLSEQITVALPNVSTAGSLRMTAFFLAILCTPRESIMVTMAGRPSGMAATARLTEVINISKIGIRFIIPMTKIIIHISKAAIPKDLLIFASRFCKGVIGEESFMIRLAICPTSVSIPVCTTTAIPRPYVTILDAITMFLCSAINVSSFKIQLASFSTGWDSPVREDSSTFRLIESISRPSAGT